MKISFTVPGEPVAKARARVFFNKGLGRAMAYTPKKTRIFENIVKMVAADKFPAPLRGEVILRIAAYRSIPKSFSRKLAAEAEAGQIRPTTTPDLSNIQKAVEDGLNGVAYRDDSQIVSCHAHKFYSVTPRTEIEIESALPELAGSEEIPAHSTEALLPLPPARSGNPGKTKE